MKSKNAPKERVRKSTVKCVKIYYDGEEKIEAAKYVDRETFINKLYLSRNISMRNFFLMHRYELLTIVYDERQCEIDIVNVGSKHKLGFGRIIADSTGMDALWEKL